jgi:hypothetical protein
MKYKMEENTNLPELSAEEKAKVRLENLKTKKSKFYFFLPAIKEANASTNEIYFQATTLKKAGYDVTLLVDSTEYLNPFYVDKELQDVKHFVINSGRLDISPEDVVVIPEIYTNVMEQTINVPAIRIVLCQSLDYMYNALLPSTSWADFGIDSVITTSDQTKKYLDTLYPNRFDIQNYTIGVPSYFKSWDKPKRPVISFVTRNPNDINKIAKDFYAKFPYYSFVTFDSMFTDTKPPRQTTRKEFADKLSKNFACVWVDRISTYGTFPLEAMACGTIPVSLLPDFDPPYIFDENQKYLDGAGYWTTSIYQVADILGKLTAAFLDDNVPESVYKTMSTVAAAHTSEISEASIVKAYEHFINKRINDLEDALNKTETQTEQA